jgi:RNA polymerase sigma-70 factor (ECF subfamily)
MQFLRSKKKYLLNDQGVIDAYRRTADGFYLGILFDRYSHLVFAVAMNYLKNEDDSKDAVISVFEVIALDLKKYEIRYFSRWLYSVTKHYCFRQLKRKKYNIPITDESQHFSIDETEEDSPLTDIRLSYLDEAIAGLNEAQQTCIHLFYLEEKSYKEIELITGYDYEKVKSHIQNGKRNMKIFLLKKK